MFSGIDDFEAYVDGAEAMQAGDPPDMPRHFALNFERGAELSATLRKEIAEHHWEVAGADAYPWLMVVDDNLALLPTHEEITIAEAMALALTRVLEDKSALLAAWNGGEPVLRTVTVKTHAGDIEVQLRVPYEQQTAGDRLPGDVLSVSALFDGMAIALFDGSRSGSGTRLRRSGMGIGYQRAMT